ncbi:heterokaryon incompatibility protein Het-C-domain-containing protein [Kalaharituber pfeilii]|nr:heterokaryon incompatibility protein Het-C-domain-containing protein [Kalaharituber pfeilii]
MISRSTTVALLFLVTIVFLASPALAFGAGNIPTLAKVEGQNFRHGDIEDTLKKLTFLKGAKWSSKLIKRVYFGNWLRDYSQAIDVGTVKSVQAQSIRVLVWVLAFMSFGFATGEFEVTEERLGVYRPEEHIDNPKDYADNQDARLYDARLRPPVHPTELAVDPATCMKNYIANENLGIATSAGYIKHSLNRSVHFGRLYTSGPPGEAGKEAHLNEALRCLGQALHTLEDFSAHSNYVELVLRELGMLAVFPHVGTLTEMVLPNGKRVFPLTTGTFGGVDFLHSVLGEAQDKFTQTELQEMDLVLEEAHNENKKSGTRHDLLSKIPNCAALAAQADTLEQAADAREFENMKLADPSEFGSRAAQKDPASFDPVKLSRDIYPILEFRDNAVKTIAAALDSITESIPGFPEFSELMDQISDQLSIYVFSVLSPYIRPLIAQAHLELKTGSTEVLNSAKHHQFEVWSNPYSTDPTHSMLSKDHFSNVLNCPAGLIATKIVEYVVPRVLFAWENVNADIGLILYDVVRVLHHPGLRDPSSEIQTGMFEVVRQWAEAYPGGRAALEGILNSDAGGFSGDCGHGKLKGGEWERAEKVKSKKKKGSSSKDKAKEDYIKIGGMKVPTGGLTASPLGGTLGGIASAALAGYKGESFPGAFPGDEKEKKDKKEKKEKKEKEEKEKDKYGSVREKEKKERDRKDKNEKEDKYGSVREKEKKKKEKDYDYHDEKERKEKKDREREKEREKEKKEKSVTPSKPTATTPFAYPGGWIGTNEDGNRDKSKKDKDKYKSSGRDYSDDEDDDSHHRSHSHSHREHSHSYSSGKYRSPSPHSRRGHSPKRSPSREHGRKHSHGYEHAYNRRSPEHESGSPPRTYYGGGHHGYDEAARYDYDYDYRTQKHYTPSPVMMDPHPSHVHTHGHQISPYGVPSAYAEPDPELLHVGGMDIEVTGAAAGAG